MAKNKKSEDENKEVAKKEDIKDEPEVLDAPEEEKEENENE